MVISSTKVRKELNKIWPDLKHIWLRNRYYSLPTKAQLEGVLRNNIIDLPVIKGFNECENFALFLHAQVKMDIVKSNPDEKYNWAFGDFIADKATLLGQRVHSACLCLTQEGCYIIEPMIENKIYETKDYEIFFVNLM